MKLGRELEWIVSHWEEFPVGPNGVGNELHVTLSRKGEILVGARAFEKLGNPEATVLFFDKVNSLIGLRPTHPRTANAYPFTVKKGCRYRLVRAAKFCRHHGIRVERTVAFNTPKIEKGMLVLDLKASSGVGRPGV